MNEDRCLFAWQAEALDAWRRARWTGIVEAVTGTGKTRVGLSAISEALEQGDRSVVLVPTKELQGQWHRGLRRGLPGRVRIGLLGDGHRDTHPIASRCCGDRRLRAPNVGWTHRRDRSLSRTSATVMQPRKADSALDERFLRRLGLTAILERPDRLENELVKFFGPICYRMGYPQALADAVIAQFSVALVGIPMADPEAARYERITRRIGELFVELTRQFGFSTTPFHHFMREVNEAADGPWSNAQYTGTTVPLRGVRAQAAAGDLPYEEAGRAAAGSRIASGRTVAHLHRERRCCRVDRCGAALLRTSRSCAALLVAFYRA